MAGLNGQKIRVSGEVKYGEQYFRVACNGEIIDNKKGRYALCLLDNVAGDGGVTVHVEKKYIQRLSAA